MENFEFYNSDETREIMLELNDRRVLWEIYNNKVDEDTYYIIASRYLKMLESYYKNLEVYCLGRSARHICIEDTPTNRRRYYYVKEKCKQLQNDMIDLLNSLGE